jgi:hypothetical protein
MSRAVPLVGLLQSTMYSPKVFVGELNYAILILSIKTSVKLFEEIVCFYYVASLT